MQESLKIIITANGEGSRMKGLSPKPKHLLYYGGKRIIDHIIEALRPFGEVRVFGRHPDHLPPGVWMECGETENRKEQLELIRDLENVLIVDCDVIPVFEGQEHDAIFHGLLNSETDAIWYFRSDCPKYGGLEMSDDRRLVAAKERGHGHQYRASGLYFLKHVGTIIDRMTDTNSIASGMVGAWMVFENTFIRVGDVEDYLNALK